LRFAVQLLRWDQWLRIEPLLSPTVERTLIYNALMTAKWFSKPKLDSLWHDAKSGPKRRIVQLLR
jgi:hypothetical protein